MKFIVELGSSLLSIPVLKCPRVFEKRKNYTFNLWPTNSDSVGTFFVLDRALRTQEC